MLPRDLPHFPDLPAFVAYLEQAGRLARIDAPVRVAHEVTEIHRRVLAENGPALLFTRPVLADGSLSPMPLLANLFGTVERVAWGLGVEPSGLRRIGEALAELRAPAPPRGFRDLLRKLPMAKAVLSMRAKAVDETPHRFATGAAIDLAALPAQICWPREPAPLITWPVVVTRAPGADDLQSYNLGVYRLQVLGRDRLIARWLAHRGGARHHRMWRESGRDMPIAIVIGAAPATILSAVLPLPETVSEIGVSGLFGGRPELQACRTVPLRTPPGEIVIEGVVSPRETAPEGPYGDHTGYYNSVEPFPVVRVTGIRTRPAPLYMSTFTGRAPDEPSRIGEALNAVFVPVLKGQMPEVRDVWLPPEACSYRIAVVSIAKTYPGQARRVMMGLWSLLPQFTYTKLVIVVDEDIDIRSWDDVMWAVATRSDPSRDLLVVGETPIDYLDFASPRPGLGGKLGIDATNKIGPETDREWGAPLAMSEEVVRRVDALWPDLGLAAREPCR